tara:strand:+ start:570 stop:749 length:180 start_codon:yes stop_codon:yes gene_type:complete
MPLNKIGTEIAPVLLLNSTTIGLSFTNLEAGLKILLLLISLAYTADKWLSHRKRMNKKK